MATRSATARWNGGLIDGDGTMEFGNGAFSGQYSFKSRFEEAAGTNPEELIHACGRVPGIDAAQFSEFAHQAKQDCLVSAALAGAREINVDAELEG